MSHPAVAVTGIFVRAMHDKSQQQHTSTTFRGSSFFIENLLGSCRTEKSARPLKDNDGMEQEMVFKGGTKAHSKAMCSQASSTGFKTEMCRSTQSPLEWYGRETAESKLRDTQTCLLFKTSHNYFKNRKWKNIEIYFHSDLNRDIYIKDLI